MCNCPNKYFVCQVCGNLVELVRSGGGMLVCCGQPMSELTPNTVDASKEKHVPVITVSGDQATIAVGSAPHPMTEEHHIVFVVLKTETGLQRQCLCVGGEPKAVFALGGAKPVAALAYCNLHGLWMANA